MLSIALAAVLLYFALRGIEWRRVWQLIAGAMWGYLVGSALISCCSYFLRALRWRILLNAEGNFSVGTVFAANMAGYLGNSFLPARAGELVRSFIISSEGSLSKTYVLTTALAERMMDAVALVLWSSVVLLGVKPKPQWLEAASRTTALIAGAGLLAIFIVPHTGDLCQKTVRGVPVLARLVEQILSGLRVFHDVRRLAGFTILTAAIWALDAAGLAVAGRAVALDLSFAVSALLVCGLGLSSALPSTPGYVGIYQFVAVTVLGPFGVSRDAALAFILMSQATGYVVVLVLGLPSIVRYRAGLRKGPVTEV
jgi:uncharacterized protein (TIRG00374 family)